MSYFAIVVSYNNLKDNMDEAIARGPEKVSPLHTADDVANLVRSRLGSRATKAQLDELGGSNWLYFVTLANGLECVVRVSPKDRHELVRQEVWAYGQCRTLGVPAPEVLAFDALPIEFPEPYVIARKLPGSPAYGRDFTPIEREVIFEQLGHYLALIHSIALPGFGPLESRPDGFTGRLKSLCDYLQDEYVSRSAAIPDDVLPVELREAIKNQLQQRRRVLELSSGTLVHGDYQLKNVLVDGDRVTGILDFENIVVCDPVLDFRSLHFSSPTPESDLRALQEGYGRPSLFNNQFLEKLRIYELLHGLELLRWKSALNDHGGAANVRHQLWQILSSLDVPAVIRASSKRD